MKNLKNLGKILNKKQQQVINGGGPIKLGGGCCNPANDCCIHRTHVTASCPGTGAASCDWLYTNANPGYPYANCCM
ncbi:hypothetical protein FBALC1_13767 [Flavobacteriales bacterium ALC-1]|nr:hypothetical protein FBALC1_13767 [Flavobacteriales bacterium ALC-1]